MKVSISGRSLTVVLTLVSAFSVVMFATSVTGQQPVEPKPADAAQAPKPKAAYIGSDMCQGCHSKIGEEFAKNPHAKTLTESPSEQYSGCESCHGPGSLHAGGPTANKMVNPANLSGAEANQACARCHLSDSDAPKSWQNIKAKYWKRGEHNRAGISCVSCHTIHGNTPKLLAKEAPDMCLGCHSKVLQDGGKKAAYVHAPVAGGMCVQCHDPHGTSARHNVVSGVQKICVGCHKPDAPEMTKAHSSVPIADANCASCHDAHSHDRQGKLMKVNQHMPFKSHQCGVCHKPNSTELVKPERELCTMCHSKDLATDPTDGQKMHDAVKRGMCTGCHNPHASDAKKGYWKDETLAYACFTCHSSVEYQVMGKFKHKPLEGLDCLLCHRPHMSKEDHLLVKPETDLCSQCHKNHGLMHPMGKKKDGSPVIDPITKGVLTCTSCHTPHGGQFERLAVRDWQRDLCTGCHSSLH